MARPKEYSEELALEKAIETFWKNGYHPTSMQDLVENMGINRASLYDTFGDKRQLYLKALETYRDRSNRAMAEGMRAEASPRGKIKFILRHLVDESLADADSKGCFFVNALLEMQPHDEEASRLVCENFEGMNAMLVALIREAQWLGEITSKTPAQNLADFVQCNINGLRVMAKTHPTASQLYAVIDQVMQGLV